ncbi:11214_t:CDS:1 [Paraglomus brasilianum]|uniref:11214_t:CDS:1 n=1 Tax=Paraglomus brasilianum TaxID=144538 RepID=A0A9N9FP68_9GLOM|nr:11214_t:CDS:1 [Paraglomus brasilianum]
MPIDIPVTVTDVESKVFVTRKWTFPNASLTGQRLPQLTLFGTSRAAGATAFYVPELDFLFDAGHKVHSSHPSHIFITHTHSDHCLDLTHHVSKYRPPNVYIPAESHDFVVDYVKAAQALTEYNRNGPKNAHTHGVSPGDTVTINNNYELYVTEMDHSVPCVGYVVYSKRKKLKKSLQHLSGKEIGALKRDDPLVEVMEPYTMPLFAFIGDTTIKPFEQYKDLFANVPVVITECTFLHDSHEENADKTKHTSWTALSPFIREMKTTLFVLIHFSYRYNDREIREFFELEKQRWKDEFGEELKNIVVWA